MIMDFDLLLSDKQSDVRAAATYTSEKSIDLATTPPRQIGNGEQVIVHCQVTTAFAGGTSVQFQLVESANANLSSPTVLVESAAIAEADLVAGFTVNLVVPVKRLKLRYLGAQYIGVGVHTAGSISAGIVWNEQTADSGFNAAAPY